MDEQPISRTQRKKPNYKKILSFSTVLISLGVLSHFLLQFNEERAISSSLQFQDNQELGSFKLIEPTRKYGFALDTFQVFESTIQNNQFLSDILVKHHIDYLAIEELAANSKAIFDVRGLRAGKPFTILTKDSSQAAQYFIYEPDVYQFIVFDLQNKTAKVEKRKIDTEIRTASGTITSSLWNAMTDNGLSYDLTSKMEDAFAWSIDFHHIQQNDQFKLIFEQNYIEGKAVGTGKIKAAYFKNYDKEHYAIRFENNKHDGFYDLEARPMKKAFLKAPVKYSRISSGYNLRRFHPVLKRRRAHLGTDYAAPYGTPIYAVANGVVTKASYTGGNGNYVKIKHDQTYETQYLHMRGFAKGIHPGVHVSQGQTIGYVGSTGLATGPHVCFRFWKNGRQVNHLRENLPPPEPMPKEDVPSFNLIKDHFKEILDGISFAPADDQLVSVKVLSDSLKFNP